MGTQGEDPNERAVPRPGLLLAANAPAVAVLAWLAVAAPPPAAAAPALLVVAVGLAGGVLLWRSGRPRGAATEPRGAADHRWLLQVNHELRTPLNGVLGGAQLLEGTPLDEGQRAALATVRQSAEALLTAVERLAAEPARMAGAALVVLADEGRRDRLRDSLAGCGWPSAAAGTGREALRRLFEAAVRGEPFGLLVLDERLPDLSPEEVFGQLVRRGGGCPTLLLCDDPAEVTAPPWVTALPRDATAAMLRAALGPQQTAG